MRRIDSEGVPHNPADPKNFVMPATMQRLLGAGEGEVVRLYRVSFDPGARTNWHVHDATQILFGLSGTCVVVDRDGTELRLAEGDVVIIDPGREHWHGAAPGTAGAHLAINTGTTTTWLASSAGRSALG